VQPMAEALYCWRHEMSFPMLAEHEWQLIE
jgi:hypothetical protein